MKKTILLLVSFFSINAIAATDVNDIKVLEDEKQLIKPTAPSEFTLDDFLKKNTTLGANPACVKQCNTQFNACLDEGSSWGYCNSEFQHCADNCLAIGPC